MYVHELHTYLDLTNRVLIGRLKCICEHETGPADRNVFGTLFEDHLEKCLTRVLLGNVE